MSRLAELLKTKQTPANVANPANLHLSQAKHSQPSQDSQGGKSENKLTPDLERRYLAMCARWKYTPDEMAEGLETARLDPAKALLCVIADEGRTDADRARWLQ